MIETQWQSGAAAPVADSSARELTARAEEWQGKVARFLERPSPDRTVVIIHDAPGIAWTERDTVHLYRTPSSQVDVDQLPHELVHRVAGLSPSRFLSEGLAVHAAAELNLAGSCWPCYRLRPSLWVTHLRRQGGEVPAVAAVLTAFQTLRLRDPKPDQTGVGGPWTLYVVAGSFVAFLLDSLPAAAFWAGYRRGACWRSAEELQELERQWRAALPDELDPADRQAVRASLADSVQQHEAQR